MGTGRDVGLARYGEEVLLVECLMGSSHLLSYPHTVRAARNIHAASQYNTIHDKLYWLSSQTGRLQIYGLPHVVAPSTEPTSLDYLRAFKITRCGWSYCDLLFVFRSFPSRPITKFMRSVASSKSSSNAVSILDGVHSEISVKLPRARSTETDGK